METLKVTVLKKDGDFYYRIRKDKKLVTVARIIRKTKFTSKQKVGNCCKNNSQD